MASGTTLVREIRAKCEQAAMIVDATEKSIGHNDGKGVKDEAPKQEHEE